MTYRAVDSYQGWADADSLAGAVKSENRLENLQAVVNSRPQPRPLTRATMINSSCACYSISRLTEERFNLRRRLRS